MQQQLPFFTASRTNKSLWGKALSNANFMSKCLWLPLVVAFVFLVGMTSVEAQTATRFNDGYLTVFRSTSGSTLASTGTAIVADEFIPTTSSQTTANYSASFPTSSGNILVSSGTSTAGGQISRSENGRYLIFPGYVAAVGAANSTFNTNGALRTVNGSGTIGAGMAASSTQWLSGNNNVRGGTSDDGTNFWVSGNGVGIQYISSTTTVVTVATTTTNNRASFIFNGQLYLTTGAGTQGIYKVGTGKPITTGQTGTRLFAPANTDVYGFSISPDAQTIYFVGAATGTGTAGIYRATYNGTTWTTGTQIAAITGYTGLAVDWTGYTFSTSAANGAKVYASNPTTIISLSDNGTSTATTTTIATCSGNNAFRGLSFSPIKQTLALGTNTPATANITKGTSQSVLFQFKITADEGNSTVKKIVLSNTGTADLSTDITNIKLIVDANNDGIADAAEISAGTTKAATISGSTITFSGLSLGTYLAESSSYNFLVIGNVASGATTGNTFIPKISKTYTINSQDYTTDIVNAGGSYVFCPTGGVTGNTLTIVADASIPAITGAATATAFTTTYGTPATAQTFAVSGSNLTANLVATAPTGFEVASDGATYGTTATFTQTAGSASGTLSVRLAANAAVTGNYNSKNIVLSSASATSVNIVTAASGNSVAAKGLTITGLTGSDKTYNGLTAASATGTAVYTGLVNGETFSVTGSPSASFATADAGNGKTITVTGYTAPSTNYTVTQPVLSANITPAPLTITGISIANKTFDGNTTATIVGTADYDGLVNGETFAVSGTPVATFADASVGNGKTVTVSGYTAPNSNYSITQPTGLTANITNLQTQTITFNALSPVTYGAASFALSATSTNNTIAITYALSNNNGVASISGNTITILKAGTVTITASQAGNASYSAAADVARVLTVNPKTITISGGLTVTSKVYDGTTSASVTGTATLSGVVAGDVANVAVTNGSVSFNTASVANGKSTTSSGFTLAGSAAANYTLTQPTLTGNITVATLTITADNVNKTYGQTLTGASGSTAFSASGLVNGETIGTVTIGYGAAGLVTATVGSYSGQATPSAATGGTFSASNYSINYVAGIINVNVATLTITASNITKAVGTTQTFAGTEFATSGLVNTDAVSSVTLTSSGAVSSAALGTFSIVPSAAVGTGLSNYTINYVNGTLTVAVSAYPFDGTTYTQNFSSLSGTTTATTSTIVASTMNGLPTLTNGSINTNGWFIYGAGTAPKWGTNDGSSNSGSFYQMVDASGGRALGSEASGSSNGFFGLVLKNTSGATINNLIVNYDAVINRNPSTTANPFPLTYRVGSTAVNTTTTSAQTDAGTFSASAGTWTSSAFGFTTPSSGTGAPGTQAAITPMFKIGGVTQGGTLTGLNWGANQFLFIRWQDTDDGGSDAMAGVDNVSIAIPTATLSGTTQASSTLTQGSTDEELLGFTVTPNNSTNFTAVTVSTTGTATASDLSNLRIFRDNNGNGVVDGADATVSGTGVSYVGNSTITFTITGETGFSTARSYIVVGDVAANATAARTTTLSIANGAFVTTATVNSGTATGNARTIVGSTGTSTITAGAGTEPATISSLLTTTGASVLNFDVTITDDGATPGNDATETKITQLVFSQGTGNTIADWSLAIGGATLTDGTTTVNGTINSGNITFSGIDPATLGLIADNTAKTYTLKIWLKSDLTTLKPTIDGGRFVFRLITNNVTLDAGSSALATAQDVNSGSTKNAVDVVGTALAYLQAPTGTNVFSSISPAVTVVSNDANGNRDLNFASSVSVTGSGLQSAPVTATASAGIATFSSLKFTTSGSKTLTASSSGKTSVASAAFAIAAAPYLTEVIVPQYMVNGATAGNRVQYVSRLQLNGLGANKTYRYYTAAANNTTAGTAAAPGNYFAINNTSGANGYIVGYSSGKSMSGTLLTGDLFSSSSSYAQFTTDASGSYTGWFTLVSTGNAVFNAGSSVYLYILLNDGNNGTTVSSALNTTTPITMLDAATNARAIKGTSSATAENMIFLYDNTAGTGRPLYGTWAENDGITTTFTSFYTTGVDGTTGAWGAYIPTSLPNGLRRIEQRSVATGAITGYPAISCNGVWETNTTVNPTASATSPLLITAAEAPLDNSLNIWVGTTNNWSTATNWQSGVVPTSTTDAYINSCALNAPQLSANSSVRKITVNSNATLKLSTFNLTVAGASAKISGTISGTGATVFAGSAAQTINGKGTVGNLTINNSNDVALGGTTTDSLNISGVLTLQNGAFTTNDKLTLKSTSIGQTATIAPIGVSGNTGTISGKVISERFIPKGYRAYRDIAPGVFNAGTIYNNWQEGGAASVGNGIYITGGAPETNAAKAFTANAKGFDYSVNGLKSGYTFNNTTGSWDSLVATNTQTLNPFQGYRLLVRGDRSFNMYTQPISYSLGSLLMVNATKLRAKGFIISGDVTFSKNGVDNAVTGVYNSSFYGLNTITDTSFSIITNPYLCPVSWDDVLANSSNINGSYWFLDPTKGSAGSYVSYNGASQTSSNGGTKYIQPGQAVFIQNLSGVAINPIVIFKETHKVTTDAAKVGVFGTKSTVNKIVFGLHKETSSSLKEMDGATLVFGNNFKSSVGIEDAVKLANSTDNLSIVEGNTALSIDARKPATSGDIIPLQLQQLSTAKYQLTVDASAYQSNGLTAYLEDKYLQTTTELSTGISNFSFDVNATVESSYKNRFSIVFKAAKLASVAQTLINVGYELYPNPVTSNDVNVKVSNTDAIKYIVEVYNTLGQLVVTKTIQHNGGVAVYPVKLNSVTNGMYKVVVKAENAKNVAFQTSISVQK